MVEHHRNIFTNRERIGLMGKTDEITSVCSKCGDSFQLKVPILCQSCESKTKSEHFNIICTSCNRRLKESDSIYCTNCFNNKCRELDGITSSYSYPRVVTI